MSVLDRPTMPGMSPEMDPSQGSSSAYPETRIDAYLKTLGIDLSLEIEEPLLPGAPIDVASTLPSPAESLANNDKQADTADRPNRKTVDNFLDKYNIDLTDDSPIVQKEPHKPSPSRVKPAKHVKVPKPPRIKPIKPVTIPEPAETRTHKNRKTSYKRLATTLGAVVAGPLLLVTLLTGVSEVARKDTSPAIVTSAPETDIAAAPTTLRSTTTPAPTTTAAPTTTEAPTTTTTEAPKPFEVLPGQKVGSVEIGAICLNAQIYMYDDRETDGSPDGVIPKIGDGTHRAQLDRLDPDPNPVTRCENVVAKLGPNTITRATRERPGVGHVNNWVPTLGFERLSDGNYRAAYPCTTGTPENPENSVLPGHRSTESAPLADIQALESGDTAVVTREDGITCTYVVIDTEIVPYQGDDSHIVKYRNPDYSSTMVTYGCSNPKGLSGDDSDRFIVHWGLLGSETNGNKTSLTTVGDKKL